MHSGLKKKSNSTITCLQIITKFINIYILYLFLFFLSILFIPHFFLYSYFCFITWHYRLNKPWENVQCSVMTGLICLFTKVVYNKVNYSRCALMYGNDVSLSLNQCRHEDFIYLWLGDDISHTNWSASRVSNLIIQPWYT